MRELVKGLLAKPVTLFNKIIIGLYLHIVRKKADGIKELEFWENKILILSPHQDDEILGCGCFIKQSIEKGNKVKCIFMTDGSKSRDDIDPKILTEMRKAEAIEVAEKLGMELPSFIAREDGNLYSSDLKAAQEIARLVEEFNPDVIMVPYFLDGHKDHSAVSGIFLKSMEITSSEAELFAYEINSPITVYGITHYVDCTDLLDFKKETLKIYASQTMSFESILQMDELNGILAKTKGGAELFKRLNLISYEMAYERYNKDNNIWMYFRQMYSIFFMVLAYFKGINIKKEIAQFIDIGYKELETKIKIGKDINYKA